jgi:hypothetical protein
MNQPLMDNELRIVMYCTSLRSIHFELCLASSIIVRVRSWRLPQIFLLLLVPLGLEISRELSRVKRTSKVKT